MDATLEAVNILVSVSCKVHTFKGLVQTGIHKKKDKGTLKLKLILLVFLLV